MRLFGDAHGVVMLPRMVSNTSDGTSAALLPPHHDRGLAGETFLVDLDIHPECLGEGGDLEMVTPGVVPLHAFEVESVLRLSRLLRKLAVVDGNRGTLVVLSLWIAAVVADRSEEVDEGVHVVAHELDGCCAQLSVAAFGAVKLVTERVEGAVACESVRIVVVRVSNSSSGQ